MYTLKYIVSLFVNYSWIKLGEKKISVLDPPASEAGVLALQLRPSFLALPLYEAFVFLIGTAA